MRTALALGRPCGEYVLGAAQIGFSYGAANRAGRPDEAEVGEMLRLAAAGGVTTVDTAAAYGDSEERLGRALADVPELKEKLRVITKLSVDRDGPGAGDSDRELATKVREAVSGSSRRLGADPLPLVLLHRASQRTEQGGLVWRTLLELVQEGRIDAVGVSVYAPEEAASALQDSRVRAIQAPASVLDRRLVRAGIPERCRSAGVALFLRSVFLQGLLAVPDPPPGPYPEALVPHLLGFHQAAQRWGRSSRDLALAYARSIDGVAGLVVGAETAAQVRENLALFEAPALSPSERARLEHEVAEAPEELVDPSAWPAAAAECPSPVERAGGR